MALPIEKWARQATLLDRPRVLADPDDQALYSKLTLPRLNGEGLEQDLLEAQLAQRSQWTLLNGELLESGDPTALNAQFAGPMALPMSSAAGAAVNPAVATETALWTAATYTPMPLNSTMAPQAYRLTVTGQYTSTATASPTLILTPRIGTTTGGATLGASRAIPLTASLTSANFRLIGDVTIRSVGDAATSGSAIGFFHVMAPLAAGAGAVSLNDLFGHTVATYASTSAQGLFMSMTSNPAGATTSITLQQIIFSSWN